MKCYLATAFRGFLPVVVECSATAGLSQDDLRCSKSRPVLLEMDEEACFTRG